MPPRHHPTTPPILLHSYVNFFCLIFLLFLNVSSPLLKFSCWSLEIYLSFYVRVSWVALKECVHPQLSRCTVHVRTKSALCWRGALFFSPERWRLLMHNAEFFSFCLHERVKRSLGGSVCMRAPTHLAFDSYTKSASYTSCAVQKYDDVWSLSFIEW